ncbi:MAG: 16S rRNA (cytidine(1402)-2'-O)-methyltransferase [Bacillota bacterium]|jgi:16S rRNA (cytidine1402-2'-O)-methyltransferase|nr:16S rRNA (cytidine(1402)-2'-O)-methyltransferase [Bacillota bacterium]HHT90591.1 16S rRNA (cytidine(1402)-2'-O)-methyltransferase [Bacillota bacterium]
MLYVCPTPIGNLEDITLRALRVLREVDLVLAEDTRHTGQLLHHFQIQQPLESLHEHNEREKAARILDLLAQGKKVALVSDAGMPGISDPGAFLIREVIGAGHALEVLPGANAALVGFLQSGFDCPHFLFYGFLPRRRKDRLRTLETLERLSYPIIFYEAPHRLKDMLEDLLHVLGDRPISISRELTKRFEETRRGSIGELAAYFAEHKPRGEFVITVGGLKAGQEQANWAERDEDDILHLLKHLMTSGLSRRSAVEQVSKEYRLPKNHVYEIALRVSLEG